MGASIIIHAVGVRSRIGFGDGDFIRAEGALQGRASSLPLVCFCFGAHQE
jgi:hypothetical protein